MAKSKGKHIALRARKANNYCCMSRYSWKSDNYIESNREKSNDAITILEKLIMIFLQSNKPLIDIEHPNDTAERVGDVQKPYQLGQPTKNVLWLLTKTENHGIL